MLRPVRMAVGRRGGQQPLRYRGPGRGGSPGPDLGRARLVSQPDLAGRPLVRGPAKPRLLGSTPAPDLDEGEVESPAAGVLELALGLLAEPVQLVGVDQ